MFLLSVPFASATSSRPTAGPAPWTSSSQTNSYGAPGTELGDPNQAGSSDPAPPMNFSSGRPTTFQSFDSPQTPGETPLAPVPEPESLLLLASGMIGLRSLVRRNR
jgi:hypothetical protein